MRFHSCCCSRMSKSFMWKNLASMKDVQLPFGFPPNLAIPLDPETIKESDLRSFAESATDDFVLLDGEYSAKMGEITNRLRENWDSLQSSRWTPRDSALLFYIVTALEDGVTPALVEIRLELLRRMFPGVAEEQLSLQKYRLRTKRAWEEKRGAILKDWVRDREDLTKKVNEGWATLQKDWTKRVELAKEHRDQTDRTTFWREKLDRLRAEKCARIRRIQVAVEPLEKVVEEKTRLRLEEEHRVKKAQRIQLAKFKESQRLKNEQEWRERAKIEMEQEHERKIQAKQNQGRVAHRRHVLDQKRDAMKEQEKAKKEKDEERKILLEKTKIPVNLTQYPVGNVLADTYASLLHRRDIVTRDEEEDEMVAFFRSRYNNSFSSEKVLRDRRNRVENKLREAGLLGNDYARQVLLAMEPKPKPHLLSTIQFKEDHRN